MSDLIDRQAAIDAVKWGASVLSVREAIAGLPSVWKPASVRPEKKGEYLALWSLTDKGSLIYEVLNYGTFEDWNDGLTEKLGWWEFDNEYGVSDFTDNVRYWTELPDKPEVEE